MRAQRCAAVRGAQRSGWGGDKRVEMVAVCPDQLNSPRTGEGWGGVLFLHRLMGGSVAVTLANVLSLPRPIIQCLH